MSKFLFLNSALILFSIVTSQNLLGQRTNDTLKNKNYDELLDIYYNEPNFNKSVNFINYWLHKAKNENNITQLMTGYQIAGLLYEDDETLLYCDSILKYSLNDSEFHFYTASAYRMKGEIYFKKRNFKKTIDYYGKSKKYADKSKNKFLLYSIDYHISILKNRLGEHSEAILINKKNYEFARKFVKNKDNYSYLMSIYALANTYNHLKEYDSASSFNRLGYKESILLNASETINIFRLNEGITKFHKNNFGATIDSLNNAVRYFKEVDDLVNLIEAYFYLGSSYSELKDNDKATSYFKMIDTLFQDERDFSPLIRASYKKLIDYSMGKNNIEEQLKYINQLIKLDSLTHTNEKYLNKSLIENYDIPNLVAEKESLIILLSNKRKRNVNIIKWLAFILLISIGISFYYYYQSELNKSRFKTILENNLSESSNLKYDEIPKNKKNRTLPSIPIEITNNILKQLNSLEKGNGFVDSNINLQSLAKSMKTNSNYLSKTINYHKGVNFVNYINNLRVKFAIDQLKNDPIFLKYTIKAIAHECGFNNTESFSSAFYKNTGLKPSFFIRELEKEIDTNSEPNS